MAEKPSFTAFVVARVMSALAHTPKWSPLISRDAAAVYNACIQQCFALFPSFRAYTVVSDTVLLRLMDKLVAKGFSLHLMFRKRTVEKAARDALGRGFRQIVIIGAGYDALALSLAREYPDVECVELDIPAMYPIKSAALALTGSIPANLHLLPCDLSTTSLKDVLHGWNGFRTDAPTLFVAEGLSMYLTEEQNRTFLRDAYAASYGPVEVVFTALEKPQADAGPVGKAVSNFFLKLRGERFTWGATGAEMKIFAASCGYEVASAISFADMQKAWISPDHYMELQQVGGENFYVLAAKKPLK